MEYIGFTTKYYTLWDVTEDSKWVHYHYVQNLSMDFNKAKAKRPNALVDLTLKGHSSFKIAKEYIPLDCFQFGKYKGQRYDSCTDYDYMIWFYNVTEKPQIRTHILPYMKGYKMFNDCAVKESQYDFIKATYERLSEKLKLSSPIKFKIGNTKRNEEGELVYNTTLYTLILHTSKEIAKDTIISIDTYDWSQVSPIKYEIRAKLFTL